MGRVAWRGNAQKKEEMYQTGIEVGIPTVLIHLSSNSTEYSLFCVTWCGNISKPKSPTSGTQSPCGEDLERNK